ncbi:hypothetical protein ABZS96_29795 [Streptomyces avermitilis]|uniref:WD40 repeat domain-containing protein n=1 Tax=Streptomyces avermitilis TaxID=33903 RepID=UPI0033AB2AB6
MATPDVGAAVAAHPAEDTCPVCASPIGDAPDSPECIGCGWPLNGDLFLGRLTAAVRLAFDNRLSAARRRFDLMAAARASGAPWHTDLARLARLEALVREGPPSRAERDEVLRELDKQRAEFESGAGGAGVRGPSAAGASAGQLAAPAHPPTVRDLVYAALARPGPPVRNVVAAEITARGLTATVFVRGGDGTPCERAEVRAWTWGELLPELTEDPEAGLFLLAGGGGCHVAAEGPVVPEGIGSIAHRALLVNRLPGWAVPERLLALLEEHLPDANSVRLPGGSAPPSALRHPGGFTAASWAQATDAGAVLLACGEPDGSVRIWCLPDHEWRLWDPDPVAERSVHQGRVTAVDLAEDGRSVVTGGKDGGVRLWTFGGSGRARVVTWHQGWVDDVRIQAGVVFSVGDDGQVRRTTLLGKPGGSGAAAGFPLRVHWSGAVTRLAVTSDGRTLVVGGVTGVVVRDGCNGARLYSVTTGSAVTALALDPADRLLAVGCADGGVRVHDLGERRPVYEWATGDRGPLSALAFGPDGSLAAAGEDGTLRVRASGRGTIVGAHTATVRAMAFNGLGELLSADGEGLVRAWRPPRTD